MGIKTVLFDLDGTLLPMEQEKFIKTYLKRITTRLAKSGYDPRQLAGVILAGTEKMVANDGTISNEEVFWRAFESVYGENSRADEPKFNDFYVEEFDLVKESCGYTPKARECIKKLKESGKRLVLATNPLFPAIATEKRMAWAGLDREDFELYTTYENSSYCKPNVKYYEEILSKIGASPEECLMVGNDALEDMIAEKLGMKVFLLTDCLINKENKDTSVYPNGSFEELMTFIGNL